MWIRKKTIRIPHSFGWFNMAAAGRPYLAGLLTEMPVVPPPGHGIYGADEPWDIFYCRQKVTFACDHTFSLRSTHDIWFHSSRTEPAWGLIQGIGLWRIDDGVMVVFGELIKQRYMAVGESLVIKAGYLTWDYTPDE